MNYFQKCIGFTFIALAAIFPAGSSNVDSFSNESIPANSEKSAAGKMMVTAGQSGNYQATANLSITGEKSSVKAQKEGAVILSASGSILLLPGTRISSGAFLYASIKPVIKNGKHCKKEVRVVTVEEKKKIDEQTSMSTAAALFSPFLNHNKGTFIPNDTENGCFNAANNDLCAVAPEQQRKVAADSRILHEFTRKQNSLSYNLVPEVKAFRAEIVMVLRL
ncbi:MAG: hypothetical protein Q8M08_08455 [Bacteroidales bacterium]|nr:hypothetical protein [Bacteroidales bacterium]